MLPTGVLNNVNVVVYVILGEVPVYLFLSIYTLLLFFWYALLPVTRTTARQQALNVEWCVSEGWNWCTGR